MGQDILQAIPTLEQDIPASQFMVQDFWVPLAWAGAILIPLAALAAWWLYRRNRKATAATISPLQEAICAMAELDTQLPPMRECSLRLSMILRAFLAGQAQDPALFETHEEFSQRMDALAGVPQSCQLETRDLLDLLAEFKYAGMAEHDAPRAHALISQAQELVTRIAAAQAELQQQESAK